MYERKDYDSIAENQSILAVGCLDSIPPTILLYNHIPYLVIVNEKTLQCEEYRGLKRAYRISVLIYLLTMKDNDHQKTSDQDISDPDISDQDISTWKSIDRKISFETFKTVVRSIRKCLKYV